MSGDKAELNRQERHHCNIFHISEGKPHNMNQQILTQFENTQEKIPLVLNPLPPQVCYHFAVIKNRSPMTIGSNVFVQAGKCISLN